MGNKTRGIILGVLGRLQKDITFDECNRNKTFYEGVKRGIKLSKKAIEEIPKEKLGHTEEEHDGCWGCIHLADKKYRCDLCKRFGHADHYVSSR